MDLYIFSDCEFGQNLSDVWHEFEALWIGSCAPLLKGLLFSGEAGTLFSVQRACFTCTFRQFWNVFRWGNDVINAKSVSLTGSNFPLFCTHVPAPCPVPRVRCFPPARQSRLGIGVNFIRILYATLSHFIRALYASVIHSHHFLVKARAILSEVSSFCYLRIWSYKHFALQGPAWYMGARYVNPRESLRLEIDADTRSRLFVRERELDDFASLPRDPHSTHSPYMPHINFSLRLFSFRGDRWQSIKQRQQTTGSIVLCLRIALDRSGSTFPQMTFYFLKCQPPHSPSYWKAHG